MIKVNVEPCCLVWFIVLSLFSSVLCVLVLPLRGSQNHGRWMCLPVSRGVLERFLRSASSQASWATSPFVSRLQRLPSVFVPVRGCQALSASLFFWNSSVVLDIFYFWERAAESGGILVWVSVCVFITVFVNSYTTLEFCPFWPSLQQTCQQILCYFYWYNTEKKP